MTANQIAYQNMLVTRDKQIEERRSNLAKEAETERSNKAGEMERFRHNVVGEHETGRSNRATESIKNYENVLKLMGLGEQTRHNQEEESLKSILGGIQAGTDLFDSIMSIFKIFK